GITSLLGFDSTGHLVTLNVDDELGFWDLNAGRQSGLLRTSGLFPLTNSRLKEGREIKIAGLSALPFELPIIAQDWFDHLCQALDRGFTEFERALLPPGTDPDPPCSTNR
ncbi:MAG: hypothetical protein ACRDTC_18480, partial [Pseudonocardiaceae bacterium]